MKPKWSYSRPFTTPFLKHFLESGSQNRNRLLICNPQFLWCENKVLPDYQWPNTVNASQSNGKREPALPCKPVRLVFVVQASYMSVCVRVKTSHSLQQSHVCSFRDNLNAGNNPVKPWIIPCNYISLEKAHTVCFSLDEWYMAGTYWSRRRSDFPVHYCLVSY